MTIKLAMSTVACPDWPLAKVAEQARAMGYDGVELRTLGPKGPHLASDPGNFDPLSVRQVFLAAGVEPVCLSTSLALHAASARQMRQTAEDICAAIALAAQIGARFVRVFGNDVRPGESRLRVIQRIAQLLRPVAGRAREGGVTIALENAGSFATAKDWWTLLDLLDDPSVGLCWNLANAIVAGEGPALSVPMLNLRIRLAKVKDVRLSGTGGFVPLGEGDAGVQDFVRRLLGIGFDGYLVVEWDRLWVPDLAPPEEYLPGAYARLRSWLDAAAAPVKKEKPSPATKPSVQPRTTPNSAAAPVLSK